MTKTINRIFGYILWIIYSNILIYASFYYNWKQQLIQKDKYIWIFTAAIALITITWLKKNKTEKLSSFRSVALTSVCSLIVSFLYFGKSLLYEETGYWMIANNVGYFLLLSLFVGIYVLFSMVIFSVIKKDLVKESIANYKYHYITLFVIQAAILCVCFYALNPGNMSYDTYNQVS
ncbi:MAG: hypothetical protein WCR90_05245, partial [Sedimentibacter sp.]